jgi:membrane protein YdbS with pleckstrin-like domain
MTALEGVVPAVATVAAAATVVWLQRDRSGRMRKQILEETQMRDSLEPNSQAWERLDDIIQRRTRRYAGAAIPGDRPSLLSWTVYPAVTLLGVSVGCLIFTFLPDPHTKHVALWISLICDALIWVYSAHAFWKIRRHNAEGAASDTSDG